jgi:hypothetical protein
VTVDSAVSISQGASFKTFQFGQDQGGRSFEDLYAMTVSAQKWYILGQAKAAVTLKPEA